MDGSPHDGRQSTSGWLDRILGTSFSSKISEQLYLIYGYSRCRIVFFRRTKKDEKGRKKTKKDEKRRKNFFSQYKFYFGLKMILRRFPGGGAPPPTNILLITPPPTKRLCIPCVMILIKVPLGCNATFFNVFDIVRHHWTFFLTHQCSTICYCRIIVKCWMLLNEVEYCQMMSHIVEYCRLT